MKFSLNLFFAFCILVFVSCDKNVETTQTESQTTNSSDSDTSHPNLILTQQSVKDIKSKLGNVPLFDDTLEKIKKEVDAAIEKGVDVPLPKDMAGGYTHTQHKQNYNILQKAGVLFQLTGEEKYAVYTRDVFMEYAKMYPTLPLHPQERSYARGKIFWQCLNDANWLVYMSQAYDCIYEWLSEEERTVLEKDLFRPFADFLSVGSPKFFNRIHNHSTWGNVGVGMIGLVMDDEELIDRALYGLKTDNIDPTERDNDGGLIKSEGKTGFLANLDDPFSPDGYYTEGPYYQRYAMYPFMIFGQALETKKPDLKIFEYKEGVLIKAVDAILNLTDADGEFFPLNDGQKGMSYLNSSLVSAVDIGYYFGNQDPRFLQVAKEQGEVQLDATGLSVALGIAEGKEKPFVKKSVLLRDGAKGDQGGMAVLRQGDDKNTTALLMKNGAHGLSHGHFDKLSFSLYENGEEVIQDYGLARFVNVEQKNGGGYLKENKTWAKQTIAHNTLIQDETTHFKANIEESSKYNPEITVFDVDNTEVQVVSAREKNAYPGTALERTLFMIKEEAAVHPYIIDIMTVASDKTHQYDFPYYYFGQIVDKSVETKAPKTLEPLGDKNGYQHLWKEASAIASGNTQFTWLTNNKFYSITSATNDGDEVIFARLGANDPKFNLRRDPAYILRKKDTKNTVFASVIESHGTYNAVTEKALNAYSLFKSVEVVVDSQDYVAIQLTKQSGEKQYVIVVKESAFAKAKHTLEIKGTTYSWEGPYSIQVAN